MTLGSVERDFDSICQSEEINTHRDGVVILNQKVILADEIITSKHPTGKLKPSHLKN